MRTPIDYLCQFCGRPGIAYYETDCPGLHIEVWQKLLACNACADYKSRVNLLTDAIGKFARTFAVHSTSQIQDVRMEAAKVAREKLTAVTQQLAAHICKFHAITTQWETDFVDIIMERPEMVLMVLKDYERRITKTAAEVHEAANAP